MTPDETRLRRYALIAMLPELRAAFEAVDLTLQASVLFATADEIDYLTTTHATAPIDWNAPNPTITIGPRYARGCVTVHGTPRETVAERLARENADLRSQLDEARAIANGRAASPDADDACDGLR